MAKTDKRVDDYIAKAPEFARPILSALRKAVHQACPDVEETIKWRFPHFMHHGILCSMAAFKAHATFGFWRGGQLAEQFKELGAKQQGAHGQFGRIESLDDLPKPSVLAKYIKAAVRLNEADEAPTAKPKKKAKPALQIPDYFTQALSRNKKALATFENFSPSCQREYVEWIAEAKRDETRQKRIAQAVEWMAEGKRRHWKYEGC